MKLRKISNKKTIYLLLFLFLTTRLINLSQLAIFNDEAIYIEWGQRMLGGLTPFYSLYDGKQPLLMWVFGIFANIFPDPVFGARLVSVLSGLLLIIGIYFVSKAHFNSKTAFIVSLLAILSPINLFYNRQALMETTVAAIGIWILYFTLNYITAKKPFALFWLAFLYLLGFYTKTSSLAYVGASVLLITLFAHKKVYKDKAMLLPSGLLVLILLIPMLANPDFHKIFSMNNRFSLSLNELLNFPLITWLTNALFSLKVSVYELLGLTVLAPILVSKKLFRKRKVRLLMLYSIVVLCFFIFTSRSQHGRYLFPLLPPLYLLAAVFIEKSLKKTKYLLILTIFWFAFLDFFILFKPKTYFKTMDALIGGIYKREYITSFTAGDATEKAFNKLVELAEGRNIIVGLRLDSGNPENTILMYARKHPNITAAYLDSRIELLPETNYINSENEIYFVSRDNNLAGLERFLIEIQKFHNTDKESFVGLYKVRSKFTPVQNTHSISPD